MAQALPTCAQCMNYLVAAGSNPSAGICRLNPPSAGPTAWPAVRATDWCASFASTASSTMDELTQRVTTLEARWQPSYYWTLPIPPTTTLSTYTMMGIKATMTASGMASRIVVTLQGQIGNTANGAETDLQICYGSGAPPNVGDPITGTQLGQMISFITGRAGQTAQFAETVIIPNLITGTTYWIGIAQKVSSGSSQCVGLEMVAWGLTDKIVYTPSISELMDK